MTWKNPENEQIKELLSSAKTIAVVGLSSNPERTSYQIAKAMEDNGYKIIPVNPGVDEVLGVKAYARSAAVEAEIDSINASRRPEFLPDIAKRAAATSCRVYGAQQGSVNQEA